MYKIDETVSVSIKNSDDIIYISFATLYKLDEAYQGVNKITVYRNSEEFISVGQYIK